MTTTLEERLERLVSSEICKAPSAEEHVRELRRLARKLCDEPTLSSEERLLKALGDRVRLGIIRMLGAKEMCVCEIMVAFNLTQPNASHHLNLLEREGVVKKRREGRWALYSLARPRLLQIINALDSELLKSSRRVNSGGGRGLLSKTRRQSPP